MPRQQRVGAPLRVSALDFEPDPVHTPVMYTTQRLPVSLTPLDAAQAALIAGLKPVVPSRHAPGGQTGAIPGSIEIRAWPLRDIAATDGWALCASDLVGASSYTPLPLTGPPAWVEAGEAIPPGCDCVLDEDSLDLTTPVAQALAEAIPGQGICRRGEEIADAAGIAAAWRAGRVGDAVHRPRVRVVNIPGGSITASLVANGLRESGAGVAFTEAEGRDATSIAHALDGRDCDLMVSIGGSGVGRTDATVTALARRGDVIAHGLALQPGRTAAIGRIGGTPLIVVPGAPDQALAAWWTLVLPALERLTGWQRKKTALPLARKIASSVGVAEIVLLAEQDGAWMPLAAGDLPLAVVARARAWLLVPGGSEGYPAGTDIEAYMLRERALR